MSKSDSKKPFKDFWAAAASGEVHGLRQISAGDINAADDNDNGRTALHKAAMGGQDACIAELKRLGADMNSRCHV